MKVSNQSLTTQDLNMGPLFSNKCFQSERMVKWKRPGTKKSTFTWCKSEFINPTCAVPLFCISYKNRIWYKTHYACGEDIKFSNVCLHSLKRRCIEILHIILQDKTAIMIRGKCYCDLRSTGLVVPLPPVCINIILDTFINKRKGKATTIKNKSKNNNITKQTKQNRTEQRNTLIKQTKTNKRTKNSNNNSNKKKKEK